MNFNHFYSSYGSDDGVTSGNTNLRVAYSTDNRTTWRGLNQTIAHTTSLTSPPTIIMPDSLTLGNYLTLNSGTGFIYVALARVTGTTENSLQTPTNVNLNLKAEIEGLYNGAQMVSDTVNVELHNFSSPYGLIDSKKGVLDSEGAGLFSFSNAQNGVPYYIALKHRNAVETWSATGNSFSSSALSYDFTSSQSQAYGSNLVQKGSKWCLYSGDANQDGIIDSGDLGIVDNDNADYVSGYTGTDVNGDGIVDSGDIGIVDNNNAAYVGKIIPSGSPLNSFIGPH